EPMVMNFRVNAGFIPKDHWTQTQAGGGRIIGEICHFIDLMQYLTGSRPVKVYAECIGAASDKIKNDDNIAVILKFEDGSVGNLVYVANGDKSMPKEHFEIFGGNSVFVIDDFKSGQLHRDNKIRSFKNTGKGHRQEVDSFFSALKNGRPMPISFESLCLTTRATFRIVDSLATGLPMEVKIQD
ncbi:MAG TPA: Gfo/Idh/MocA family oxidoreductase, partial [Bacteroidales bacterium]|nr:Gfo/Idh/MocA family oxidoreductase [Bacteroidales bacterium]